MRPLIVVLALFISTQAPARTAADQFRMGRAVPVANDVATTLTPVVTTLAGNGSDGYVDGTGKGASFGTLMGVAVDSSGNVYVVDVENTEIRKISPTGVTTTLAGSPPTAWWTGFQSPPAFSMPWGVAVDSSGNVYVADAGSSLIRKVSPAGVVTTLAGSGSWGSTDGTGTAASFDFPTGVAVDASGNVYVADCNNRKIRMVSPAGVVTTLAGSGSQGSTDGTGTAASFNSPTGVAVDASGNVYVAGNYSVRKINPAGVVTTLAGSGSAGSIDGTGTAASFNWPNGVAVDASGDVYVADSTNNKIRVISSAGVVTTLAGSGAASSLNGVGCAAGFASPSGVAVDASGSVYVSDLGNHMVRKIAMVEEPNVAPSIMIQPTDETKVENGRASLVVAVSAVPQPNLQWQVSQDQGNSWSNLADGGPYSGATQSALIFPSVPLSLSGLHYRCVATNPLGSVSSDAAVLTVIPGGVVTTLAGSGSAGSANGTGTAASFNSPGGVAVDAAGNVYVADCNNRQVRKVTPAGEVTTLAGSGNQGTTDGPGDAASFGGLYGAAVDASGNVYVTDIANNMIRKISPTGVVTTLAGTGGQGSADGPGAAATFNEPAGVAVDASGNVYVADYANNKIREISPTGVVTTLAGTGGQGSADGAGTAASFTYPHGVAVDVLGNVYVADTFSNKIREISPAGMVTTLAGSGSAGSLDGLGTAASFNTPEGVAVDAAGNVYVADSGSALIRKISPAGAVTTLAGGANSLSADGTGGAASFSILSGVAVDAAGNLYVGDSVSNKIRKIAQSQPEPLVPVITWASPGAITYGAALTATQLTATASVPGSFVYTPAAGTIVAGGAQTLSVVFTPADTTEYVPVRATRTLTVDQAPLTARADDQTRQQYAANPALTITYSGFVNGENSAVLATPPTASTTAGANSPVGTYPITLTGGADRNYVLTLIDGTLTVSASPYGPSLQRLYQDVLGRDIDPGALASCSAALAAGWQPSELLADLYGSLEYSVRQIEPVIRLYSAAFARQPDYLGLQNWLNNLYWSGLDLGMVAEQFAGSQEFTNRYGSLDNAGYVQQLYRNVLGREADLPGLADWVGRLESGASRGQILVGFSESAESKANMADRVEILRLFYLFDQRMPTEAEMNQWIGFLKGYGQTDTLFSQGYPSGLADPDYVQLVFEGFLRRPADADALSAFGGALTAGTMTHGSVVETLLNSTEFNLYVGPVSRLYLSTLLRVPDAPGLDNWVNYAKANSLQTVADQFAASQEFQSRYGAMDDAAYVTALYENILGREPDPSGLADWVGQLQGGTATRSQILLGFTQSPEAIQRFAPTVRTFLHYFTFLNTPPTQQQLDTWASYLSTLTEQTRTIFLANLGPWM